MSTLCPRTTNRIVAHQLIFSFEDCWSFSDKNDNEAQLLQEGRMSTFRPRPPPTRVVAQAPSKRKGYNWRLLEYSHLVLITRSAAKFEKVPSTNKHMILLHQWGMNRADMLRTHFPNTRWESEVVQWVTSPPASPAPPTTGISRSPLQ